jgi:hypothetical protein
MPYPVLDAPISPLRQRLIDDMSSNEDGLNISPRTKPLARHGRLR